MPDPTVAIHFYLFMKWFKAAHLDLYKKYRLHVVVPTTSYEITFCMDNVDHADVKPLADVIKEYYASIAD